MLCRGYRASSLIASLHSESLELTHPAQTHTCGNLSESSTYTDESRTSLPTGDAPGRYVL